MRRVAVKVIHPHLAHDEGFRARFAREVSAARRVNGLYTAEVVDADPAGAVPWMATRFIEGPSLYAYVVERGPLSLEAARFVVAGVAEALTSIHAVGLVHRDLKPSNVVLAPEGPHVIDFGIAVVREAGTFTSTGVILGTFEYMSPEQVNSQPATAASDVFALGGLLHYALTGRPAFGSGHPATLITKILECRPDLSGVTDPDLHSLVAACLAKDPDARPAPAQIVAATADGRPAVFPGGAEALSFVGAVPPDLLTPVPTTGRTVGRRALLGAGLFAAGAGVVGVPWGLSGRSGGDAAAAASAPVPVRALAGHTGRVAGIAFRPDGKSLVAGTSSADSLVVEAATGKILHQLSGHRQGVAAVVVTPDGRTAITGSEDTTIVYWDLASGTATRTLVGHGSAVMGLALTPDGKTLASAGE